MNHVYDFWKNRYSVERDLEADSWLSRAINRHVVAGLLNTFPKATTKVLSFSRGEFARLLIREKEGGSYRTLRAMYDYKDPQKRGDLINRVLMQTPAVKAARNRRVIAQQMLQQSLKKQSSKSAVLVLAIGGGDGRLEAEVIAKMNRRDIYYCGVDKDDRAVVENQATFRECGLEERGFVHVGNISEINDPLEVLHSAEQRFGVRFDGAHIAVCHGIAEYLDVGVNTNETLSQMLSAVYACVRTEGRLIISHTDFHDRVRWVERGLLWSMRLRDMEELSTEIEKAGWQISICEHEPMRLISMCLALKSADKHMRIDSPSQLQRPRAQKPAVAAAR